MVYLRTLDMVAKRFHANMEGKKMSWNGLPESEVL